MSKTADDIREAHGENPFSESSSRLHAAKNAKAKALAKNYTKDQSTRIAAHVASGKTFNKAKSLVLAEDAAAAAATDTTPATDAASAPTVKSIRNSKEEKKRGNPSDPDRQRKLAESYSPKIVKAIGKVADAVEEMEKIESEIEDRKKLLHEKQDSLLDKLRKDTETRNMMQFVRDYFAGPGKSPNVPLFLGKYRTGPEWSAGEIGTRYDYVCRCLNKINHESFRRGVSALLLGEGYKEITVPGTPVDPGKAAENLKKAVRSAVSKVLANHDVISNCDRHVLVDTLTDSLPKDTPIIPEDTVTAQGITAKAVENPLPSHAISVRGQTALIVDVYGGTRVAIRDVDMSLLAAPVLADVFGEFLKLVGKLADGDQANLLRSFAFDIDEILNSRKTIDAESNPTEEAVA